MIQGTRNYFRFLWRCGRIAFVGDWCYYGWMGVLTCLCLIGLNAYAKQFAHDDLHCAALAFEPLIEEVERHFD